MALPVGISTATLTVGSDLSFTGEQVTLSVEVEAHLGGSANHIVWAATGQPLDSFIETFEGASGNPVSFQLPHVNQAGFVNGNGDAVTMWAYTATITARKGGETKTRVKNFQPVVGQTTIDLDRVPDGSISVPSSAPILPVSSVAGLTDEVTLAELVTALTPELQARADAKGLLAYAENRTGTVTYSTGAGAPIEGMAISVPPSAYDVELAWGVSTGIAIGGEGAVNSVAYEVTGGGAVPRGVCVPQKFESSTIATAQGPSHEGRCNVGPSTTWRTFILYLSHYSATGSGLVGYAVNGDTDYSKTYLQAEAK